MVEVIHVRDLPLPTAPADGARWGVWVYDAAQQLLRYDQEDTFPYEIDLDRSRTGAACAGWLMHMSQKRWITTEDLGNLVRAFAAFDLLYRK
jgi:hypothetical protein